MTRKEAAIDFLKRAAHGDAREAYAKYVAPDFIHHNQYFKGDRESLLVAMEEAHAASPNKSIEVRKAVEEGDTVFTLSRVVRVNPSESDVVVVHVFRFVGDRVAELWDVGQLVEKDGPNENGAI